MLLQRPRPSQHLRASSRETVLGHRGEASGEGVLEIGRLAGLAVATHQLERTAGVSDYALTLEAGRVQSFTAIGARA